MNLSVRPRRRYQRLHHDAEIDDVEITDRSLQKINSAQTVKLGNDLHSHRRRRKGRFWRIRRTVKLRFLNPILTVASSPAKIWNKLKDGYVNMMLNLADAGGISAAGHFSHGSGVVWNKRIPRARKIRANYSADEFENRLILEIYKALAASRQIDLGSSSNTSSAIMNPLDNS